MEVISKMSNKEHHHHHSHEDAHPPTISPNAPVSTSKISPVYWILLGLYFALMIGTGYYFYKPFLAERHFREGYNFYVMNRLKYAIEELEAAVKYAPLETHYQIQLSKAYESMAAKSSSKIERLAWFRKAESTMLNAMKYDDISPWFKSRLANIYEQLAKEIPGEEQTYIKKAESYHHAAAIADKSNPIFQLNYAYFLHQQNRLDEAKPFYDRAKEIDDSLLEASYNLGDIFRRKGQIEEAKKNYLFVFEKNPSYNRINLILGSLYINDNNKVKALDHLQRDYLLYPQNENAILNLASINYQVQRYEAAAYFYDMYMKKVPEKAGGVINNYAQSLNYIGKKQDAIAALENYLKTHPDDRVAKSNLSQLKSNKR